MSRSSPANNEESFDNILTEGFSFAENQPTEQNKTSCLNGIFFCCHCFHKIDDDDIRVFLGQIPSQYSSKDEIEGSVIFSKNHLGAVETGYLRRPSTPLHRKLKTMVQLRKENSYTCNLPSPLEAININNQRSSYFRIQTPKKPSGDRYIEVVNTQLRIRLSSSSALGKTERANEWGEALLIYNGKASISTQRRTSRLLDATELQAAQTRTNYKRRSSAFNLTPLEHITIMNNKLLENPYLNLDHLSLWNFINTLLNMSNQAKKEVQEDSSYNMTFVKNLERYMKKRGDPKQTRQMTYADRWMVTVYILDDFDAEDDVTVFRYLMVRLLLQSHCVAYNELKVNLTPVRDELARRLNIKNVSKVKLPQLFYQGTCIGGCQILYTIYTQKLIKVIFSAIIMDRTEYSQWLCARTVTNQALSVDVKLKQFTSLMVLAKSSNDYMLSKPDLEKIKLGKDVVMKARQKWHVINAVPFREVNIFYYTLIRATIYNAFDIMNAIYVKYIMFADKELKRQAKDKNRRISWLPKIGAPHTADQESEL